MREGGLPAERYAALEQAIYEASVIPEQWPAVLQSLGDISEARGAVLLSVTDYRSLWTASEGMREDMREFIEGGWADRNTRMAAGLGRGLHLVPRFVTERDYYDPGELERDTLYRDFFYPKDLGNSAGMVAVLPHGDMICINVEKPRSKGPISSVSLAVLDSLRPHLARAAMMTARVGLERLDSAIQTLTQLGFAAAAVNFDGKVLVANDAFAGEALPWTTGRNDRIGLADARAGALLRAALETINTVRGVRSIPLRDEDQIIRNVLHVLPVRRMAHDIFTRANAILVMTTTSAKPGSPHLLQALFDLTPAEAALTKRIGAGQSLDAIAAEEGRSVATLRSQLRSILAKTGCSRQAELTRMLALLVPPGL
jgi:DNA-binding CsgD family transcriptional regulator